MKMEFVRWVIGAGFCVLTSMAHGQLLDVVTGPNLDSVEQRLYRSAPASEATLAPLGTALWLVSDGGAAGIPTVGAMQSAYEAIRAGTADDKLIGGALSINGSAIIGSQAGVLLETGVQFDLEHQNKPIFAVLWSDDHGGDGGDTFGVLELTLGNGRIVPPLGLGNYELRIDEDIFADQFTLHPVPELPYQGVVMGIGCLLMARAWKKRRQEAATEKEQTDRDGGRFDRR